MTAFRAADLARLVVLAAIWGASFVFIRVVAPAIGPWWTACARLLVGGLALVAAAAVLRVSPALSRHGARYVALGLVNSALPFVLYGYAALHLPASYLVILNTAYPMFAALLAPFWLGEAIGARKLAGLAIGVAGVALVSGAGPVPIDAPFAVAVAASLAAALCYAIAGIALKRVREPMPPLALAAWSQLSAGVALLPPSIVGGVPAAPSATVVVDVLVLGLVCSALAYLLYFRLIRDVGPTRASTVTFLMPAFGIVWGALFLDEAITVPMVAGAALIVAGTAFVLRAPVVARRAAGVARDPLR